MWFEDGTGRRDFLDPLGVEGLCIEGVVHYELRETAPDAFEMLAEVSEPEKKSMVEEKIFRQMKKILHEKNLDYVQFYVRFTDKILPDPITGKKPLIVPFEKIEIGEAV